MNKVTDSATIDKHEPMPSICKLCTSMKKHWNTELSDTPQENDCFLEKELPNCSEQTKNILLEYRPFTNSKRKVLAVCKNFSHVRKVTTTYK